MTPPTQKIPFFGEPPPTEVMRPRFAGLAALLYETAIHEDATQPVFLGCLPGAEPKPVSISLAQLRNLVIQIDQQLEQVGVCRGDSVALFRLPRTSELLVAIFYVALSVRGCRVLFPMAIDRPAVAQWLTRSCTRCAFASLAEVRSSDGEEDQRLADDLVSSCQHANVPVMDLDASFSLTARITCASDDPAPKDAVRTLHQCDNEATECLVLTTSGSSGDARLVRYTQGALLRSCASWDHAGLFNGDKLGGRCLSLLLGHSMGVRALWNAVWSRQPLVLITPEWFLEAPDRASALLARMKPQHVTGGTATFFALLEMARAFPSLKEDCFQSLRTLVSSGTAFDQQLQEHIRVAFGHELHNALGTTETMQVTSTLVSGPFSGRAGALGNPLPGVQLRLDPSPEQSDRFRLFVRTVFGAVGVIENTGEHDLDSWHDTGDLVCYRDNDLYFVGRADDDFFSDGVGVKLSRLRLQQLYHTPPKPLARAIELFPLRHEPGLAALVFLTPDGPARVETEPDACSQIRAFFETRLEGLRDQLDDFELRHNAVHRFTALRAPLPETRKGTPRRRQMVREWAEVLERLTGRTRKHPHIVFVDTRSLTSSASTRFVTPRVGALMRLLKLDKQFVSARGDRLVYRDARGDHEVVDFVGGYGANLLGHRHPEVVNTAISFLEGQEVPTCDQGSRRAQQGHLAATLASRMSAATTRPYVIRFASTGAEAVEMALSHAALERDEAVHRFVRDQRRGFGHAAPARLREIVSTASSLIQQAPPMVIAVHGSFHGHTSTARALLDHPARRRPFTGLSGVDTVFIGRDETQRVADIVSEARVAVPALTLDGERIIESTTTFSRIIAAVVEPVQGEGGVYPVPTDLFAALTGHSFPLIADEIQAGLGRTGSFLASPVVADYTLFSKALGGGICKIAALAIDRARYVDRFDTLYSSTFAGDAFSSVVANRVLEIIAVDDIPNRCAQRGDHLRAVLERIAVEFPTVIGAIRGRGLLLGIELRRKAVGFSPFLRAFASDGGLGVLAAAYLLNRHDVRVMPTLSAPDVLRVEPSAYVDDAAIDQLREGLTHFCRSMVDHDVAEIVSFLLREERRVFNIATEPERYGPWTSAVESPAPGAQRVAFIGHMVHPERELALIEPSLRDLSVPARRALVTCLVGLMQMKPAIAFARNMFDNRVWFCAIWIPADAATLETLHRMDYRRIETERLQESVDLAAARGCQTVALGGYTSILSRDGTAILPPPGVQITSGNTLTAVVGSHRIERTCAERGLDRRAPSTRAGVVGATGNIGNAVARRLLTADFRRLLLVGREPNRVRHLRDELARTFPAADIEASTRLDDLADCNVIAIATNTNEPLLYPRHIPRDRPVVIADVSVPSAVSRHLHHIEQVSVIPLAGTVLVPGQPDFTISSHTTPGTAFCCAAEAMLLGLEPVATRPLPLVGRIDPSAMEILEGLANRHGFLADLGEGGFRS